jgi:hypothetical protein
MKNDKTNATFPYYKLMYQCKKCGKIPQINITKEGTSISCNNPNCDSDIKIIGSATEKDFRLDRYEIILDLISLWNEGNIIESTDKDIEEEMTKEDIEALAQYLEDTSYKETDDDILFEEEIQVLKELEKMDEIRINISEVKPFLYKVDISKGDRIMSSTTKYKHGFKYFSKAVSDLAFGNERLLKFLLKGEY